MADDQNWGLAVLILVVGMVVAILIVIGMIILGKQPVPAPVLKPSNVPTNLCAPPTPTNYGLNQPYNIALTVRNTLYLNFTGNAIGQGQTCYLGVQYFPLRLNTTPQPFEFTTDGFLRFMGFFPNTLRNIYLTYALPAPGDTTNTSQNWFGTASAIASALTTKPANTAGGCFYPLCITYNSDTTISASINNATYYLTANPNQLEYVFWYPSNTDSTYSAYQRWSLLPTTVA